MASSPKSEGAGRTGAVKPRQPARARTAKKAAPTDDTPAPAPSRSRKRSADAAVIALKPAASLPRKSKRPPRATKVEPEIDVTAAGLAVIEVTELRAAEPAQAPSVDVLEALERTAPNDDAPPAPTEIVLEAEHVAEILSSADHPAGAEVLSSEDHPVVSESTAIAETAPASDIAFIAEATALAQPAEEHAPEPASVSAVATFLIVPADDAAEAVAQALLRAATDQEQASSPDENAPTLQGAAAPSPDVAVVQTAAPTVASALTAAPTAAPAETTTAGTVAAADEVLLLASDALIEAKDTAPVVPPLPTMRAFPLVQTRTSTLLRPARPTRLTWLFTKLRRWTGLRI